MELPEQIAVNDEIREKIKSWTSDEARQQERGASRALRETVEFAVMVIILWLLLRAFELEPFVIPTGSMAPTLMGRHMDVTCSQCGFDYQTGASKENGNRHGGRIQHEVTFTVCPICRHEMELDREDNPNQRSFSGDRILVSKIAYQLAPPNRWDVAVFKFPGDPKVNYIKRLVGLPGETLKIRHGDIYVSKDGGRYAMARKPPAKLVSMLQVVDDTRHTPPMLNEFDWPSRWQSWPKLNETTPWKTGEGGNSFSLDTSSDQTQWLRYRHLVPDGEDWEDVQAGHRPRGLDRVRGQLISDFYAYNNRTVGRFVNDVPSGSVPHRNSGPHWVGDLALECSVQVKSETGRLILDLVEGGVHYRCGIDIATGTAMLSMDGKPQGDWGDGGAPQANPTAKTKLRGRGRYELRFSNCDDELLLWIDGDLVKFDVPTTYTPDGDVQPKWTDDDPLDLAPAGIGGQNALLSVCDLQILRDIYYIASKYDIGYTEKQTDYDRENFDGEEYGYLNLHDIVEILRSPMTWEKNNLFASRRHVEFTLAEDQFFALGDNSPESKDARIWSDRVDGSYLPPPFVDREFLTGKAFLIYWPHTWKRPIPFWPNFKRIGFIR